MKSATLTFAGAPCRRGHDGSRYTSSGGCVECARLRDSARPPKPPRARSRRPVGCVYELVFASGRAHLGVTMGDPAARYDEHARAAANGSDAPVAAAWRREGPPMLRSLFRSRDRRELHDYERDALVRSAGRYAWARPVTRAERETKWAERDAALLAGEDPRAALFRAL